MSAKKTKSPDIIVKKKQDSVIPKIIYAQASPKSVGGVSLFDGQERIQSKTVGNFVSEPEVIARAVNRLRDAGFQILQVSSLTINIAAPASTYEWAFNTKIIAEERPVIKEGAKADTATFLDSPDTDLPGLISTAGTALATCWRESLSKNRATSWLHRCSRRSKPTGIWTCRRGFPSAAMPIEPDRSGITGKGIKVAMVDSGWFKHPFFVNRGYRAAPVLLGPAAANPLADESGHGTGESANIFAVAPDVELLPVKINFVNSTRAFNAAVGLNPHIITCSWGSSTGTSTTLSAADQVLAAAIALAVGAELRWSFPPETDMSVSPGIRT